MSEFSILSNRSPLAHEAFSAHRALEQRLRATVRGEVRFDVGSRALYATDASNYRQLPIGVVIPRDEDDVIAAIAACRATGAAVLPRGGGTSLAGQCTNVAVVFDYSKYMRGLSSLDPAARLATVQPGLVLDRLREAAELHQLTYAPDPATHSRCTLGGMIGNNSCGVHGLLGGKVVDNVESLDVLLYDGTRMTVGATSPEQLEALIAAGGRAGQIYAGLKKLSQQYGNLVRAKFPRIPRRVSGYNLDELLPESRFHVARALVGSEGTCVNILSAQLNLTSSPQHRVLTVLAFPDAFAAADAVPLALEHKPIGLEGFDQMLVDFMRRKGLASRQLEKLPPGANFLLVEMGADSEEEAQEKSRRIAQASQSWPDKPIAHICTAEEAKSVWYVRESALGAVVFVPGEPDRYEGWEDSAVPPEKLGAYLRAIHQLMAEYNYSTPVYGHYGQGCVHMRINFDFRSDEGIRKFRAFVDRAADVVLRFGGSFSGEHGDGQARAALLPKMFGAELMQAFQDFKRLWDPDNRMNPGKLIDLDRVYDPVENLRAQYAEQHRALVPAQPLFAFTKDEGSLERAAERCVGVGACRGTHPGVMCPSYRATGEEMHSTRGRAHLLWEMMAGSLQEQGYRSQAVHEALSLCLSCKACKSECPVQVDMAQYKSEFLAQHYARRLRPLHHYVFGFADKLARWGSLLPRLTNWLLRGPLSWIVKRLVGIAPQRTPPQLASTPYTRLALPPKVTRDESGASSSETRTDASAASPAGRREGHLAAPQVPPVRTGLDNARRHEVQLAAPQVPQVVVLWPDTWNNYYYPGALVAAEKLLLRAGFRVFTPKNHICCGRPLYDFGLLDAARRYLADVLDRMGPQIEMGVPIIFLEPSCASVFTDELPELFPNDPRAQKMGKNVWLLADFLAAHGHDLPSDLLKDTRVLVHGHCHHKAVFGGPESEIRLLREAGAQVEAIQAGCCGMAGPFGFEADKFEVSETIANQDLLPAVRAAGPDTVIVADGFSCREQIHQLGHRHAHHFAEVLAGHTSPEG